MTTTDKFKEAFARAKDILEDNSDAYFAIAYNDDEDGSVEATVTGSAYFLPHLMMAVMEHDKDVANAFIGAVALYVKAHGNSTTISLPEDANLN